jgi:hypothetical protein
MCANRTSTYHPTNYPAGHSPIFPHPCTPLHHLQTATIRLPRKDKVYRIGKSTVYTILPHLVKFHFQRFAYLFVPICEPLSPHKAPPKPIFRSRGTIKQLTTSVARRPNSTGSKQKQICLLQLSNQDHSVKVLHPFFPGHKRVLYTMLRQMPNWQWLENHTFSHGGGLTLDCAALVRSLSTSGEGVSV